ncbi:MAG: thioredoxin family protein [Bacteroides sp.]|nr:thioredoxin family protein [Bacteroides sp.]MCM1379287.1 thioredoxin family protein [Bacteroides sp.]MCM1445055.1 thioredoxin family protein [Prevotella sp.]
MALHKAIYKWLAVCSLILTGCSASRQWAMPEDLTQGDAAALVGEAASHGAIGDLMYKAETTLLDANQPRMAQLLEAALQSGKLSDAQTATAEYMLYDVCLKNAPDSIAADFRFATPEASENRLHSFRPGETLLLLFYDPNCSHCREVISELAEMKDLPTVLAVCIESSPKLWEQTRDSLPEKWIKAYDRSGIISEDLYVIRSMPSIYLLDGDRRVILKNPQLWQLRK